MRFYNRNGTLYVDYSYKNQRVRKSTNLKYNSANKKLVESALKKDLLLSRFNQLEANQEYFVNKLVLELIEVKRLTLKETSLSCYSNVYDNCIKSYFKDVLVTDVSPKFIKLWQNKLLSKGLSSSTIRFARSILKQMFDNEVLEEKITANPMLCVRTVAPNSTYEINPFSLDEIRLILDSAQGHFKNLLGVAFFSGMRIGEIIGLKWSDIDLDNRTVSVNRTINKGHIQTPKTKSSKRVIEIIDACLPYILNQQLITKLYSEFIFLGSKNVHYSSSYNLRYSFKKILDRANVDYRCIYQTRHSFASLMLNEGENLIWVSSMLGHKTSDVTLKKYSKFIKKDNVKRAKFLDTWHTVGTRAV